MDSWIYLHAACSILNSLSAYQSRWQQSLAKPGKHCQPHVRGNNSVSLSQYDPFVVRNVMQTVAQVSHPSWSPNLHVSPITSQYLLPTEAHCDVSYTPCNFFAAQVGTCTSKSTQRAWFLQIYGYMCQRGLRSGIISSYHWSWICFADGRGSLSLSQPVYCTTTGTETELSCLQVICTTEMSLQRQLSSVSVPLVAQ